MQHESFYVKLDQLYERSMHSEKYLNLKIKIFFRSVKFCILNNLCLENYNQIV